MKAVVYEKYGPPEEVLDLESNFPRAFIEKDSDQVLVKVLAASLTHKDLKTVLGDFKTVQGNTFPAVLGGDVSGTVEAVGDRCRKFKVGDEVIGIVKSGSMAEYVSAAEWQWVRKPKKVSHLHAAAFPFSGVLAFQCLHLYGKLKKNEKILILNGSGGVGSLAVQMAKYKGAKVYATASKHVEMVESLGADIVLDYARCQWWEQLAGENVDVILDFGVGYAAWVHSGKVLNPDGGRFISLVPDSPDGPVEYFGYKFGSKFRSWSSGGTYQFVDSIDLSNNRHLQYVAKMVQLERLRPVLDPESPFTFSSKGVRVMMEKLMSKHTRGKLIMNIACNTAYSSPEEKA